LLDAYVERSLGKKTLIFNNGIETSKRVYANFTQAGYDIRHLDNTHTAPERREILQWFREKPDAILTSVSILTTGFDEPTVESIILNRATKSLTLYFQMIGRGSRVLPNKKEFSVTDLGNNLSRFGLWEAPIDWMSIFRNPEMHLAAIRSDQEIERAFKYVMPDTLRAKFSKSSSIDFDVKAEHQKALREHHRPHIVIDRSLEQHLRICMENSTSVDEALALASLLKEEIEYRVRIYARCLSKTTESYVKWMQDEYKRKLKSALVMKYMVSSNG
jgi:type I site-specific restriction endonuclease